MDYAEHFSHEVTAFSAAARSAAVRSAAAQARPAAEAPAVPSCPHWVLTDLVLHLGMVHRLVWRVIAGRLQEPPEQGDRAWLELPDAWAAWLPPGAAPRQSPVPPALIDWFEAGAAGLLGCFRAVDPATTVWTWSADHTVGFWQRMQAIEAAIHRWDAENAVGTPAPLAADLAADAVGQTFSVMAPARRAWAQAPPGAGEQFLFRRTDGPGEWPVRFNGSAVQVGAPDGPPDVTISGTASELALFVWQRPATIDVQGDTSLVTRYFELVPPL